MDKVRQLGLQRVYTIWGFILIVWSLYRFYIRIPEWMDDLIFKPLLFLLPVLLYVLYKERRPLTSIGLDTRKLRRDLLFGAGFGLIMIVEGIVANIIKYNRFSIAPVVPINGGSWFLSIILALAAAFSEEVLARGFLYTRLKEGYKSEFKGMIISTAMYFLLLVPAIFTISHLTGVTLLIFIMTTIIMSAANTMLFSETKTITIPVLVHAFWNVVVALYL